MYNIKEIIKDKFWIVESNHGKIGTIRKVDDKYDFFNQINHTTETLDNLSDFQERAQGTDIKTGTQSCSGYPTNSTVVYCIENETLPLFKKSKTANTVFAAGYYVIKFKDWLPSFCPKHATIAEREFLGPFFTEWEMNIEMKRAKKAEYYQ